MMNENFTERVTEQRLNFIEQIENQINLCREAMNDERIPLTPKVEALESLLWAKLKDDTEYKQRIKNIDEAIKKKEQKEMNDVDTRRKKIILKAKYSRARAKLKFKQIIIFIDKKNYVSLGDDVDG